MSEKVDTSRIQEWDDKAGDCCDDLNHVSGNDWPIEVIGEAREIIRALLAANESLAKDAEVLRKQLSATVRVLAETTAERHAYRAALYGRLPDTCDQIEWAACLRWAISKADAALASTARVTHETW